MDILGAQFNPISGEASIQDIGVSGNFSISGGDWIMWWDPNGNNGAGSYTKAFYWGVDENDDLFGVYSPDDEDYENPLGAGWGDPDAFIVDASISAGKGFWSQAVNGGSIVIVGEVPSSGTVSLSANKMDLVCNPYAVDTDIQTISVSGNFSISGGDWIMWWDPTGNNGAGSYTKAFYWGVDETDDLFGVYDPKDEDYEDPLGAGWGDPDAFIIRHTIPAGHGFWCQAVNGGSLVFADPTAANPPAED